MKKSPSYCRAPRSHPCRRFCCRLALSATAANAATTARSTWDALAQCESGGNWAINTGNGFSGGLQFTPRLGLASVAPVPPQTLPAPSRSLWPSSVQAGQGWGAWPACAAQLGLSGGGGAPAPQIQPQSAPVQAAPVQAAPVQAAPVQAAPVQVAQAPVQAAPVQTPPSTWLPWPSAERPTPSRLATP